MTLNSHMGMQWKYSIEIEISYMYGSNTLQSFLKIKFKNFLVGLEDLVIYHRIYSHELQINIFYRTNWVFNFFIRKIIVYIYLFILLLFIYIYIYMCFSYLFQRTLSILLFSYTINCINWRWKCEPRRLG